MNLLHDPIRLALAQTLLPILAPLQSSVSSSSSPAPAPAMPWEQEEQGLLGWIYRQLVEPPQREMGHYAFATFPLSKILRQGPPQIAQSLAQQLPAAPNAIYQQALPQGPFINFHISLPLVGENVLRPILSGQYFQTSLTKNAPRTMIEYSQPNTHKEMHVGHMRNLALGHSLVLLHRYCQFDILSATFPGDVGTHVAKCLWYLKNIQHEPIPSTRKGAWLGTIYSRATLLLEDEEEKNPERFSQIKKDMAQILAQIEQGRGEYFDLWKETRQWSIELMQEVYAWAQVSFDHWYWESDVDSASVLLAKKYFQQGLFIQSEGAVGMDLSGDKLGFCMMLKSDGNGLYATKDLELARRKFEQHHIEKSVYVVDTRQTHHFAQVFKVLEKVGFAEAAKCLHLGYEMVELPDGAMSSRKGNIVGIQTLIDKMVEMIKTNYLVRYRAEWSAEEIHLTAHQVAVGAINYGMLRIDPARKIVFNMEEWLKLDGESGPYLQYVYARINSLCLKQGYAESILPSIEWEILTHQAEEALMLKLAQFNSVVLSACEQYKTSLLCTYLYQLGKIYNNFYVECSIAGAPTPQLRLGRLALSKATGSVMEKGLNLLGIPAPQRM